MKNELSVFERVDGFDGIFCARKGTLRCTAIQLKDGSLCLFSPVVGLNEVAVESLASIGEVSFLFAPNHYHNKGIAEYANAFPKAKLVASEDAIPRLQKVTGASFAVLDPLSALMPKNMFILYPEGLKTGEIWIRVDARDDPCWVVVDAFCTTKENSKNAVSNTPEILGTFPKMGVANASTYRAWVERQIEADKPGTILPCHGSIIQSDRLGQKLRKLMSAAF